MSDEMIWMPKAGLNVLNDRIKELEKQVTERDAEVERLKSNYWYRRAQGADNIESENKRIFELLVCKEKQLQAAVEVIKYYADHDYWQATQGDDQSPDLKYIQGKRARQFLKEMEGKK